jgi:hypothetical protein
MFYVKEHGFYYEKMHGPYATLKEAMANKPTDKTVGREEAIVTFTIESTQGTVQQLNG